MANAVFALMRNLMAQYAQELLSAEDKVDHPDFKVSHLQFMAATAAVQSDWPEDKLARWLGFVQAGMALHGIHSVAQMRAETRPLFHSAYALDGRNIVAPVGPT